jgi:hypothetical protein
MGPAPVDYLQWDPGSILDSKPSFQDLWDREGGVPGITADSSAVLPWGSGCNANELAWRRQSVTATPDGRSSTAAWSISWSPSGV